jgi:hypothetical protein
MEPLSSVMSCNCSLCSKRGALLAFVPASQFRLLSGEDSLTDYQFNKKVIHHLFCKVCSVASFGRGAGKDGTPMIALNTRCLDNVDVNTLTLNHYDGKNA